MQVIDPRDVKQQAMEMPEAEGVRMRVLVGPEQGAPTSVMRQFEIEPGGHTPLHSHAWEHQIFILSGEGELASADMRLPLVPGAAAVVPPGETHQFVNTGRDVMCFLCIIPAETQ